MSKEMNHEIYLAEKAKIQAKADAAKGLLKFTGKALLVVFFVLFALGASITGIIKYNDHRAQVRAIESTFVAKDDSSEWFKIDLSKKIITYKNSTENGGDFVTFPIQRDPNDDYNFKAFSGKGVIYITVITYNDTAEIRYTKEVIENWKKDSHYTVSNFVTSAQFIKKSESSNKNF